MNKDGLHSSLGLPWGSELDYPPVSLVLLAGGKSSRMGTNKALLRFADGTSVVERMLATLRPLCTDALVVTNTPHEYAFLGLPMYADAYPGASSLGGIYTGLLNAAQPRALALSCDLPLVNAAVVRYLLRQPFDYDLLVPFLHGKQQPLHAIYAKSCLEVMRQQIEAADLKIIRLMDRLRARVVDESQLADLDPEMRSFRNMNTPEDWANVRRIVGDE